MIIEAETNNFKDLINNETVLVDFYANWCGPCKMLAPNLDELADTRSDLKIVKVNVDELSDIAKEYGVMTIPTLIMFKSGSETVKHTGYMGLEDLTEWIESNK